MRTEEEIRKEIEFLDAQIKTLDKPDRTKIQDWVKSRKWALVWVLDELEDQE